MKQLLQYVRTGRAAVVDVPAPGPGSGKVLIQVANSLVSAGTERMVVDFAEKNLLEKARSRPDLVKQTIEKAQREGLLTTFEAIQNRLDQPMALGYSCTGRVIGRGNDVTQFEIGDRVACAGGGYAVHAELVSVPKNLVVKLPNSVGYEAAAFSTLAAIALQGVRLAEAKLGDVLAVIGLGLLGQLTVQLLKANGCQVIGFDIQPQRAELALQSGADAVTADEESFLALCRQWSNGYGVDGVLITADTKSNRPVEVAGEIARERGLVVAVGAVGMAIPRKLYYEKELDFRISRSYGPGRYDPEYEEKGHDYPYGYVRWTQQRNMAAFVQLVATNKVNIEPLISHRFPIGEATKAYELITGKTGEPFLGVLLAYPQESSPSRTIQFQPAPAGTNPIAEVRLGVLGAGNFANATLLPALKTIPTIRPIGIASGGGVTARSTADRFGFAYATTDSQVILQDPAINTVAILTRHHLHASQVLAALAAGKNVFVEKPLCLTHAELMEIVNYQTSMTTPKTLMVGFNRRFAPFIVELKARLQRIEEPLLLNYRANVGYLPANHWTQDPTQGGGRLLGEACHFIDLLIFLADSQPVQVMTQALPDSGRYQHDNFHLTLTFANGSIATIIYVANGDKALGKEFLEVFGGGLSARMDDYRTLTIRQGNFTLNRYSRLRQDKGHQAEWLAFAAHLTTQNPPPMSLNDIIWTTQATLAAQQSLEDHAPVRLV